jgi:hypothetical protein
MLSEAVLEIWLFNIIEHVIDIQHPSNELTSVSDRAQSLAYTLKTIGCGAIVVIKEHNC